MPRFVHYLLLLLPLTLGGCMLLKPIDSERNAVIRFEQQPLEIRLSYNELLLHRLTLDIGGHTIFSESLGNPEFPAYSETARSQLIYFKTLESHWQGYSLHTRCHLGRWQALTRYPRCTLLIDQQAVAEFDFN